MNYRAAIVDKTTGKVTGIVMLNEETQADPAIAWPVPENCEAIPVTDDTGPAYMGGDWNGGKFGPAPVVEAKPGET